MVLYIKTNIYIYIYIYIYMIMLTRLVTSYVEIALYNKLLKER